MTTIRHTIKRNETYHFNIRLTDKIYRKSLKTDSPSLCRVYVSDILIFIRKADYLGYQVSKSDIDEFIEMLISNQVNEVARIGKAITEPLSHTAKSYFNRWYTETNQQRFNQYNYDNSLVDVSDMRPEFRSYSEWITSNLNALAEHDYLYSALSSYNADTEEIEINDNHELIHHFKFPSEENAKYDYLSSLINTHISRIATANKNEDTIQARMELSEIQRKFAEMLPAQIAPVINNGLLKKDKKTNKSKLFQDIEVEFVKDLSKGKTDTYMGKMNAPLQDLIVAFYDCYLDEITADSIEDAWFNICRLPRLEDKLALKFDYMTEDDLKDTADKKTKMRFNRWDYILKFGADNVDEEDFYKEGQLKNHKTLIKRIFIYAYRKGYISSNPIDEFSIEFNIPAHRSGTRTKIPSDKAKLIIDYCFNHLEDPYSWAFLLMAYQGMRNKEVADLMHDKIVIDSDTKIAYINVIKGKTNNARRKIPIHKLLLNHGFMDFVDSKIGSKLFEFDSKHMTNHFSYFRDKFDIPRFDLDGNQINLYSFRHNVISALGDVSDEHKYRLIGHGNKTVTTNYTALELSKAQMLINTVTYEYNLNNYS